MTAQVPETLILEGERVGLAFCPPLPFGDPRFGITLEGLALEQVARAIASDVEGEAFREVPGESFEPRMELSEAEFHEAMMAGNARIEARMASLRAKRVAEALAAASDEPADPYYAGEVPLSRRTTAEQLEAAIDLALAKGADPRLHSTACWRGYQGVWEIREDKFYLVAVHGDPEFLPAQPILADWFTGVLRIPRGEVLAYRHMGFASLHEEEIHIKIEKGIVTKRRVLSAKELASRTDMRNFWSDGLPGSENRFPGDEDL